MILVEQEVGHRLAPVHRAGQHADRRRRPGPQGRQEDQGRRRYVVKYILQTKKNLYSFSMSK